MESSQLKHLIESKFKEPKNFDKYIEELSEISVYIIKSKHCSTNKFLKMAFSKFFITYNFEDLVKCNLNYINELGLILLASKKERYIDITSIKKYTFFFKSFLSNTLNFIEMNDIVRLKYNYIISEFLSKTEPSCHRLNQKYQVLSNDLYRLNSEQTQYLITYFIFSSNSILSTPTSKILLNKLIIITYKSKKIDWALRISLISDSRLKDHILNAIVKNEKTILTKLSISSLLTMEVHYE